MPLTPVLLRLLPPDTGRQKHPPGDRGATWGLRERRQHVARAHALFMLTACSDDICKLTANILSTCWSVS